MTDTMIEFSYRTILILYNSFTNLFAVPPSEFSRILFHGLLLACIISGFWLLDSLKDPILSNTIGIEYQPIAKLFTVLTTLFVVCIYDYFTHIISKPYLFHVTSWIYGICFLILSAILSDPIYGITESQDSYRIVGWIAYFATESYGSLMVALFWSFSNSVIDLEDAKGAYGLIIALGQLGAITGSTIATSAHLFGLSQLFIIASMNVFTVSLLIKAYCIIYKENESVLKSFTLIETISDDDTTSHTILFTNTTNSFNTITDMINHNDTIKSKVNNTLKFFSGFTDGFLLIIKYPYALKILAISCLYEIIITVLDYEFKLLSAIKSTHITLYDNNKNTVLVNEREFANLLGHFGQLTNIISFFISIFGYSYVVKSIGVKYSLLIFPIILFIVVIITNIYSTLEVLFISVSLIKALTFSLHDPIHELLYNPTCDAIKFKAKVWIDVFGSRSAKAIGSLMTNAGNGNIKRLRSISEIPCLIISILILFVAWSIGEEFQYLVKHEKYIGFSGSQCSSNHEKKKKDKELKEYYDKLPVRNGLLPGEVGYDGYDEELFDGVFKDEQDVDLIKV